MGVPFFLTNCGVATLLSHHHGRRSLRQRLSALFQDHEIFIRTHGQVRFVTLTTKMQKQILTGVAALLILWAVVTAAMIISRGPSASELQEIAEKQAATSASERRIAAYRDSLGELAADLDARQGQLEEWQKAYFGQDIPSETTNETEGAPMKVSQLASPPADPKLPPEARKLMQLAQRQDHMSAHLLAAVKDRAENAELAVKKLGLNPDLIVRNVASGRGGPFIPYRGKMGKAKQLGGSFADLERALFRMEVLERTLVALPSGNPANVMMMSSGFGYRSDPFNGAGAMHAGLDFRGPTGTPILAAAPGRVTFVGTKSGYGQVIEVDHGQSIMTRYAHLSGYTTQVGQQVAAGEQIGKMGSTGRSTGSHLHFEVRLNGVAVNPRRFLEAKADVLDVKADARQRVGAVAGRAI